MPNRTWNRFRATWHLDGKHYAKAAKPPLLLRG
jgi:hypothetical protein